MVWCSVMYCYVAVFIVHSLFTTEMSFVSCSGTTDVNDLIANSGTAKLLYTVPQNKQIK